MREINKLELTMPVPEERAWHKSAGKMLYSTQYSIDMETLAGRTVLSIPIAFKLGEGLEAERIVDYEEDGTPVVESELVRMKRTGLKDKNGVEIYEGDVISSSSLRGNQIIGEVYFADGMFCKRWGLMKDGRLRDSGRSDGQHMFLSGQLGTGSDPMKWEVIGNIYENPELLERAA